MWTWSLCCGPEAEMLGEPIWEKREEFEAGENLMNIKINEPILKTIENEEFELISKELNQARREKCGCDHCKTYRQRTLLKKAGKALRGTKKKRKSKPGKIKLISTVELRSLSTGKYFFVCSLHCKHYIGCTGIQAVKKSQAHLKMIERRREARRKLLIRSGDFIKRRLHYREICGIGKSEFEKPGGKLACCVAIWLTLCWKLSRDTSKLSKYENHLLKWCERQNVPNRGKSSFT